MGVLAFIAFFLILSIIIWFMRAILDAYARKKAMNLKPGSIPKKLQVLKSNSLLPLTMQIGLVLSLVTILSAFEWRSPQGEIHLIQPQEFEEPFLLEIPPTTIPPPPKPRKIQMPKIEPVPDDKDQDEEKVEFQPEPEELVSQDDFPDEEPEPEQLPEGPILVAEEMPTPVGGMQAFYDFLSRNIKYPEQARRMAIEGKVFVEFVIGKDGMLQDIRVVKGIGGGCDEEALRVLNLAPKWNPGMQRGRPVMVRMTVPVYFKLG